MRPPIPDHDPFLDRTLEVFQPRTARSLSPEDARVIARNLTGFFETLIRWDQAEQESHRSADPGTPAGRIATPNPHPAEDGDAASQEDRVPL